MARTLPHRKGSIGRRPSEQVMKYLSASYADSTRDAYRSDVDHFIKWGGHLPSTARQVAEYLAAHGGKLANSTLARRLVAINLAHRALRKMSPTTDQLVRATLKGIFRKHRSIQRQVAPLLKDQIVRMVRGLRGVIGVRDSALLLVGFAGAFRRSELVRIEVSDLDFVKQGVVIKLRYSKTDQEGKGRNVAIPYAKGAVCPVLALHRWIRVSGIQEGKVFRAVNRHGTISMVGMRPNIVGRVVKQRAAAVGLDPSQYAGHSLRAGLVTSAAKAGVSSWKIRQQTGHKSDAMVNRYIRDDQMFVDNAAARIL